MTTQTISKKSAEKRTNLTKTEWNCLLVLIEPKGKVFCSSEKGNFRCCTDDGEIKIPQMIKGFSYLKAKIKMTAKIVNAETTEYRLDRGVQANVAKAEKLIEIGNSILDRKSVV